MATTLLSRRLNPTTLLQSPNPLSQSLLLRNPPFLFRLSSFTTTKLPTSSLKDPTRSRSDSIATFLFSTWTRQRSHLSPPPFFSTAAATSSSSSLSKPTNPHSKERRRLSSSSADPKEAPKATPKEKPELRHQEITGPTVERDTSALANETRQVLESLRKSVYDASVAVAVLGGAHLALGAWIAYGAAAGAPREVAVQALAASAFPLAAAFLMRRTLKPLGFFSKMEDMGRLQILTLALQSSKNVRTLLLRIRVAAIFCVLGVSAGSLPAAWTW